MFLSVVAIICLFIFYFLFYIMILTCIVQIKLWLQIKNSIIFVMFY